MGWTKWASKPPVADPTKRKLTSVDIDDELGRVLCSRAHGPDEEIPPCLPVLEFIGVCALGKAPRRSLRRVWD